jgi:hypothetical protein
MGMEGVSNLYPFVVWLVPAWALWTAILAASMSPGDAPTLAPLDLPAARMVKRRTVLRLWVPMHLICIAKMHTADSHNVQTVL